MMIDVNVIQDQIAWLNQRDASYGGTTTVLLIHFAVKCLLTTQLDSSLTEFVT